MRFLKRHGRTAADLSLGLVIAAAVLWNADAVGVATPANANLGGERPAECPPACLCSDGSEAICCGGDRYCPNGSSCGPGNGDE